MQVFLRHTIFGFFFFFLILLGCLAPGSEVADSSIIHMDKFIHAVLYFLFTFCMIVGLIKQPSFSFLRYHAIKLTVIFSLSYGLGIELIQHFIIDSRTFELMDVVADFIGCFLGLIFFKLLVGKETYCQL